MTQLPETILQFGSGKFLRGFADLFIHQANEQGQNVGRIVVVQTTGDRRAARPGLQRFPCALFEHTGDVLLGIVARLAESWQLPADFCGWLRSECAWRNTLVDRIVTATPVDHPSLKDDGLYVVAEPYSLWA